MVFCTRSQSDNWWFFVATYIRNILKICVQVMGHQENRPSAKQVVKDLIAQDGWKGFYRGLGPRFFSMSAWGTSMILTYEYLSKLSFSLSYPL